MAAERTIVEYFPGRESHRCGYCGSPDTNCSNGMWAHTMTVQDYQDLIDRGWRRSGKYCYKPTMNVTCCPNYTIKCGALDFRLNKSHKKLIKRINKYLISGEHKKAENESSNTSGIKDSVENMEYRTGKFTPSDIQIPHDLPQGESSGPGPEPQLSESSSTTKQDKNSENTQPKPNCDKCKTTPKPGKGADPNLPACKKAKQVRLEKKAEKLQSTDETSKVKAVKSKEKTLEEFLNEPDAAENPAHKLEIKLVQSTPQGEAFVKTFTESHKVYHKYQMDVHKDPPEKPNPKQYKRFLCDSPLKHVKGDLPMGYGSFHQHYILDGKLIAVGVIDILPTCVSSVYLYYDTDYDFLSLGTYTALREIAFVRELNKYSNNLKHYYMGFYIHSCPKMRYKGQYYPSFIACPETYQWVPIETCRPKLDKSKYSRLSDSNAEDENGKIDVKKVLVLYNGEAMPYEVYKFLNPRCTDESEVNEYATLTGKTCSERMVLFRK